MKLSRPKVEIRNPTLFEMETLEEAPKLAGELKIERPFSLPGILLGPSAFTAAGWETFVLSTGHASYRVRPWWSQERRYSRGSLAEFHGVLLFLRQDDVAPVARKFNSTTLR